MIGPASQTVTDLPSVFTMEAPFDIFADELLHELRPVCVEEAAQRFNDEIIFVFKPAIGNERSQTLTES